MIGILPVVALVAVALAVALIASLLNLSRRARAGSPLGVRSIVVAALCSLTLWAGWSYAFMVLAALGHSAHPLASSWRQCLLGFLVLVAVPAGFLLRLVALRGRGGGRHQDRS